MIAGTKLVCEHISFSFSCYLPPSATKKLLLRMSFLDFQRDKREKAPAEVQDSSSVISPVPVVHADPQRQASKSRS